MLEDTLLFMNMFFHSNGHIITCQVDVHCLLVTRWKSICFCFPLLPLDPI